MVEMLPKGTRATRAAIAAITAIRPTEFNELLAPEGHASAPAATRADIDFGKVEELHGIGLSAWNGQAIQD